MKEKKILDSLNLLDDKYIAEADPNRKIRRSKWLSRLRQTDVNWMRIAAVAACFCIVLSSALWLFVPFSTDPAVS